MRESGGIVVDGYERGYSAMEPEVRTQVAAEYGERLAKAGLWERWRLRREMEREIVRRVHEKAPPDALY